jgi:hypothetical protein
VLTIAHLVYGKYIQVMGIGQGLPASMAEMELIE